MVYQVFNTTVDICTTVAFGMVLYMTVQVSAAMSAGFLHHIFVLIHKKGGPMCRDAQADIDTVIGGT